MCIYIYVYIFVWLHVHAETFMANRWRHAVSVTFFSPRITHPRVTDLPSRAKLQIKKTHLGPYGPCKGNHGMTWWCFHQIWWIFLGEKTRWSAARHRYSAGRQSFHDGTLTASRGHEAMKRWLPCFNLVKETWDSLKIFSRFSRYIYILFYKFARTINLWTLQRLLRLWKNRSSTASSFRENPGLLGLNQGRMMGWLKYFEVLHLRCKP